VPSRLIRKVTLQKNVLKMEGDLASETCCCSLAKNYRVWILEEVGVQNGFEDLHIERMIILKLI
jgi:hypothetical protein